MAGPELAGRETGRAITVGGATAGDRPIVSDGSATTDHAEVDGAIALAGAAYVVITALRVGGVFTTSATSASSVPQALLTTMW